MALPPCAPWDLAHSALKNCIHKTGSDSMSNGWPEEGSNAGMRLLALCQCPRKLHEGAGSRPPYFTHIDILNVLGKRG